MLIKICDFGPISKFEFDLTKDLNVFFGKNNIGKSYAITVVYLIIKHLTNENNLFDSFDEIRWRLRRFPYNMQRLDSSTESKSKLEEYIASAHKKINNNFVSKQTTSDYELTDTCLEIVRLTLNDSFIKQLQNSFDISFSSLIELQNKYSTKPIRIEVDLGSISIVITQSEENHDLIVSEITANFKVFLRKVSTNRSRYIKDDKVIFYLNTKNSKRHYPEQIISRITEASDLVVNQFIFNSFRLAIKDIYFLPASRSGLYQALSAFSAVIAELSKSRNFLSNSIELPNISEPVSDYFLHLSSINENRKSKNYRDIIQDIEKKILKGEVLVNPDSNKIVFSPLNTDVELDLSFSSSMISEIAPIVAYFKYIIDNPFKKSSKHSYRFEIQHNRMTNKKRDILIFIEEPEAHLHPEIQVELLKIFVKLTTKNVKVVMTSHSNYIFNKLSNIVLGGDLDHEKVGSYLMRMTNIGSILDKESMSADEEGLVDQNFADIAEELYEERINIYEKMNANVG